MDRVFIDRFKDTGWKLINGSVTRSEPVGYCRCNAHKGWMTLKLVNSHECLKKNCPFLDKNTYHPYWKSHDLKKQKAKLGRILRKNYIKGVITRHAYEKISSVLNKQKSKAGLINVCHMMQLRKIDIPDQLYAELISGSFDEP